MKLINCSKQTIRRAGLAIAALGFALVLSYILLGRGLITAMYESNISILGFMQSKTVEPIAVYFAAADQMALKLSLSLVLGGAVWWLLFKNPLGVIFSAMSFSIGSFVIFLLLDQFPVLIKPLHWDIIPYFNYRVTYVPDPIFGFREKPYNKSQITNFRGCCYSPVFGIDVPMSTVRWQVDGEGFRNQLDISVADIAVIGSSFVEYGTDFENTYSRQLEIKLDGLRVVNLSKAGFGPFQYLQVLSKYAIKKKVRYVLITFHPSSDTEVHLAGWLKGNQHSDVIGDELFPRFRIAVQQTGRMLISGGWTVLQVGFRNIVVGPAFVHPDVAVLKMPNGVTHSVVFLNQHTTKSTEDLLRSPQWYAWARILGALKELSEENQIVPLLVYIPMMTEIYSEYISPQSGTNWLRLRESLIATKSTYEEAARAIAATVGIEMISLRPAFEEAARQGKLVYYPFDQHWNEKGREIAAAVTADALRAIPTEKRDIVKAKAIQAQPEQVAKLDSMINGLMERSISGSISLWNEGAEELYGWTKEEAIGRVSHELLQTQFPEPLEQINDQLLRFGRWQGKLVHATRDGRRVEVVSDWRWTPKTHQGAIVEINKLSATL